MKTALITTTINVPKVLELYRACSAEVMFIVTGDKKTPDADVANFLFDCGDHLYLGAGAQGGWRCSELIGWNTIARRNIALLEALRWGAELIVTVDDDNAGLSTDYFDRFEMLMGAYDTEYEHDDERQQLWSGLSVSSPFLGWFDPGALYVPPVRHRGYPHQIQSQRVISPVTNVKIGAASGVILGDPDIGAVERIAKAPEVHSVSELLRAGIVVDPKTYSVFNTQNTAFLREFAPCFLMIPGFGRYDDIWASLLCQRIMREKGYVLHIGQPFVYQQRNQHDLVKDLRAEMTGMQHTPDFARWLDEFEFKTTIVAEMVREFYSAMPGKLILHGMGALVDAWCEDVQEAMK